MEKPKWFDIVRDNASNEWEKGESSDGSKSLREGRFEELKGDIRHVIPELLQNADDARAKEVEIYLDGNIFIFEHDGDDFNDNMLYINGGSESVKSEGQFCHLCNFGTSTKKSLETTGNYGLGFKTTFSLGPKVKLFSPTLSVEFRIDKFFVPNWLNEEDPRKNKNRTRISVEVIKEEYEDDGTWDVDDVEGIDPLESIKKSINDWKNNLESIHLFKHISSLTIDGKPIKTEIIPGPIEESSIIKYIPEDSKPDILKLHFETGTLPKSVCMEIKARRGNEKLEELKKRRMPVNIMINISGDIQHRLYSILPVQKHHNLSFSIDAPFIMGHSRSDIADLDGSKTNKWILESAGSMSLEAINKLIRYFSKNENIPFSLSIVYSLLPYPSYVNDDPVVLTINNKIKENFNNYSLLIDIEGNVVNRGLLINPILFDVWDEKTISNFYKNEEFPILSKKYSRCGKETLDKLEEWGIIRRETNDEFFSRIIDEKISIICPDSPEKIGLLWDLIYTSWNDSSYNNDTYFKKVRLFPSKTDYFLHPVSEILIPYNSPSDKIPEITNIPDNLYKYIESKIILFTRNIRESIKRNSNCFHRILTEIGRINSNNTLLLDSQDKIIKILIENVKEDWEYLLIARIASIIDARIPKSSKFLYLTESGIYSEFVYIDDDGLLDAFLPEENVKSKILSKKYISGNNHGSDKELETWEKWIRSDKSGIHTPFQLEFDSITKLYDFDKKIIQESLEINSRDNEDYQSQKWVLLFCYIITQNSIDNADYIYYRGGEDIKKERLQPWIEFFIDKDCLLGYDSKPHYPNELYYSNYTKDYMEDSVIYVKNSYLNYIDSKFLIPIFENLGVHFKPGFPEIYFNKIRETSTKNLLSGDDISNIYKKINKIYTYNHTPENVKKEIIETIKSIGVVYTNKNSWNPINKVCIRDIDNIGILTLHPKLQDLIIFEYAGVRKDPTTDDKISYIEYSINNFNNNKTLPLIHKEIIQSFELIEKYYKSICHEEGEDGEKRTTKILKYLLYGYTKEMMWVDINSVFTKENHNIPNTHLIHPDISKNKIWEIIGVNDTPTIDVISNFAANIILRINNKLPNDNFPHDDVIKSFKDLNPLYKHISANDSNISKKIFSSLKYIYSDTNEWIEPSNAYLENTFNIPFKYLVNKDIVKLDYWNDVGVKSIPDYNTRIQYIKEYVEKINLYHSNGEFTNKLAIDIFTSFDRIYQKSEREQGEEIISLLDKLEYLFTDDDIWEEKSKTYIKNNYDIPGTYLLNTNICNFEIWKLIGVKEKPNSKDIISYLDRTSFSEIIEYSSQSTNVSDEKVIDTYNNIYSFYKYAKNDILYKIRSLKIYTKNKTWEDIELVYLSETDIPDSFTIFDGLLKFSYLWKDLDMHDNPNEQDYLDYLIRIPDLSEIDSNIIDKIRYLFRKKTEESLKSNHLICLGNKWVHINEVSYYLDNESLIPGIYDNFKIKVADYSFITDKDEFKKEVAEYCGKQNIKNPINLYSIVERKVKSTNPIPEIPKKYLWIKYLAKYLVNESIPESVPGRDDYIELGNLLLKSKISYVEMFYDVPYVGNQKISDGTKGCVRWEGNNIFISKQYSIPKCNTELQKELANHVSDLVSEKIGRLLGSCSDKDEQDVYDYCRLFFDDFESVEIHDNDCTELYENDNLMEEDSENSIEREQSERYSDETEGRGQNPSNLDSSGDTERTLSNSESSEEIEQTEINSGGSCGGERTGGSSGSGRGGELTGGSSGSGRGGERTGGSSGSGRGGELTGGSSGSGRGGERTGGSSGSGRGGERTGGKRYGNNSSNVIDLIEDATIDGHGNKNHHSSSNSKGPVIPKDPDKYSDSLDREQKERQSTYTLPKTKTVPEHEEELKEPNTEERDILDKYYNGECQLCHHKYPKMEGDDAGNTKFIYTATNILRTSKLSKETASTEDIGWNSLCLCPTCSERYKDSGYLPSEFNAKNYIDNFDNYLSDSTFKTIDNNDENRTTLKKYVEVPIRILKEDEKIGYESLYFNPGHFASMAKILRRLAKDSLDHEQDL